MAMTRITQEEARTTKGDSDMKRLEEMTEEEISEAARNDPDNPPLTDEQLKQFKRRYPREKNDQVDR